MDKRFVALLLLISAILSGFTGAYIRTLNDIGFTLGQITFMFLSFTAIVMFIGIMIYDRSMLKIHKEHIHLFIILGIAKGIMDYTYVVSLNTNAMSFATVLQMTSPFFIMIIAAIFFREKITTNLLLSLVVFILGAMFVSNVDPYRDLSVGSGFAIGLTSGLMLAIVIIMTKIITSKGYHPVAVVFYGFAIGSLILLPFTDYNNWGELVMDGKNITIVLAFAIFCTLIPYTLDGIGIKHLKPMTVSIIMTMEVIFSTIVGVVMFREGITWMSVIGIALVIVSIIMVVKIKETQVKESKSKKKWNLSGEN